MKSLAKQTAEWIARTVVLPAVLLFWCAGAVIAREKAFAGWSQLMSLLPGLSGVYLRRAFYRMVLPRCGDGAWIGFGTFISHPTAGIGSNVYVGSFCVLGDVTLEDDVLVGSHVSIINGNRQHGVDRLDVPIREQPGEWPRVTIGTDTWIGDRSIVMADVGGHCVVGAGSVVTKSLPDYSIAVGNPARVIRDRRTLDKGPAESRVSPDEPAHPGQALQLVSGLTDTD